MSLLRYIYYPRPPLPDPRPPLPDPRPPLPDPRPPLPDPTPPNPIPKPKPPIFRGIDTATLAFLKEQEFDSSKDSNIDYDQYYLDALVKVARNYRPDIQTDERDSEIISTSSSYATFTGNDGNNTFTDIAGSTTFIGGEGVDTVVFTGKLDDYEVDKEGNVFLVSLGNEIDTLLSIERIEFADAKLALDLDGNAGTVAKVYGALFGDDFSTLDKQLITTGLNLLDNGLSYEDFASAALIARGFNNNSSIDEIVSMLYTNVVGLAPTAEQAKPYIDMFNNGEKSATDLVVLAAEVSLNEQNINLIGLSSHGLMYA